ncbi:PAS domain S-box-containing protein [Variovorax sp. OAS795]|uniref:PAS domain-containing protein n=1 Tax=Variovorax sp. OAS795 TaxID=3034231 RepID=UPI00339A76FF
MARSYDDSTRTTVRKRVAKALPTPDLRTIIDAIPVLAWTAGPDGAADFFNSYWVAFSGLSSEESVAQGWSQVLHPEDRERVLSDWQAAVETGVPIEMELRLRRSDGDYLWFLARAQPLRDASGQVLKWYGTSTEIDARRKQEHLARESADSYSQILDRVPAMLFTTTAEGELEFVNGPLLRYFGTGLEALQAWKQAAHLHPDDLPHTIALWSQAVAAGEACLIEHRMRRHDGVYRWFQFQAVPQRDDGGRLVRWYGSITDLDDVKRKDAELRAMETRLSSASKMAAVSQLSAAIAHEVSQPLAAVVANGDACTRWLSMQPPNIERALQSLERVGRDAAASADVVQRIRLLFQRAPLVREPLDLNAVTTEVLQMLHGELLHTGVTPKRELEPTLPVVQGDRVQIQQVLSNLLRNALEALGEQEGVARSLTVSSRLDGDEAIVFVTDSGPGLSDPHIIFQPFFTTKRTGMGMGLAISRTIVEAHGGRLWATSEPGAGATFALAIRV